MANCERPKCAACGFVNGHRRFNKVNIIKNNNMKDQDPNKDHIMLVQMVFADQYTLRDPGRLYHTKGKSGTSDMLSGGFVLIDHANSYVVINHQVAIKATETVKAKVTLEREAQIQVVAIKIDLTDNGIFDASEFMEDLLKNQQNIRFSGAVASHRNGSSERAIKTIVTMERTRLIYAEIRCPHDTFYTDIWPMAMDYSVWVYNQIPDMQSG